MSTSNQTSDLFDPHATRTGISNKKTHDVAILSLGLHVFWHAHFHPLDLPSLGA